MPQRKTSNKISDHKQTPLTTYSNRLKMILQNFNMISANQLEITTQYNRHQTTTIVYRRSSIFIAALARKHKISANSCFDIIDQMAENKQITQNTDEELLCAVTITCKMRLKGFFFISK